MYKVALRAPDDARSITDLHGGKFDAVIVEARDPEREQRCSIVCLDDEVFKVLYDAIPGVRDFRASPQGTFRIEVGESSELVMDALLAEFGIEVLDLVAE